MEKAFTHGGIFHADDVFGAALLRILYPGIEIGRGNQVPDGYDGLVFDIGRGVFDHHQEDKRIRENGVPYAAFGLLWEAYGTKILEEEDAAKFDEKFVQDLDLSDNTGEANILASCIADFNPVWDDAKTSHDEAFFRAVSFAEQVLVNRFCAIRAERKAYDMIREQAEHAGGNIMVMEQAMPWKSALRGLDIDYVIFPSLRGGYMVQAVSTDEDALKLKKPFPKDWRGKTEEELKEITGIGTLHFCHVAGFLCAVGTLADAQRTAELALKKQTR